MPLTEAEVRRRLAALAAQATDVPDRLEQVLKRARANADASRRDPRPVAGWIGGRLERRRALGPAVVARPGQPGSRGRRLVVLLGGGAMWLALLAGLVVAYVWLQGARPQAGPAGSGRGLGPAHASGPWWRACDAYRRDPHPACVPIQDDSLLVLLTPGQHLVVSVAQGHGWVAPHAPGSLLRRDFLRSYRGVGAAGFTAVQQGSSTVSALGPEPDCWKQGCAVGRAQLEVTVLVAARPPEPLTRPPAPSADRSARAAYQHPSHLPQGARLVGEGAAQGAPGYVQEWSLPGVLSGGAPLPSPTRLLLYQYPSRLALPGTLLGGRAAEAKRATVVLVRPCAAAGDGCAALSAVWSQGAIAFVLSVDGPDAGLTANPDWTSELGLTIDGLACPSGPRPHPGTAVFGDGHHEPSPC